jgi:hypothetical protein
LNARAIAWADAPVNNSAGCIKPIAVPYAQLMYRINLKRGIANTPDDSGMYRPWDNDVDLDTLNNMTEAERTFSLKIGAGNGIQDTLGYANGNYQAVKLGEYWDVSTGQVANPGPDNGGDAYKNHLSGGTCYNLTVGDSLETESGNMAGPTICGAVGNAYCNSASGSGICATLPGATDNTQRTDPTFGECRKANGSVGVDIKAALYRCMSACSGASKVEVSLLGSFTLKKIYPEGSTPQMAAQFEKAEIVGIFKPVGDPGSVGPGATTLTRPILVK